MKKQLLTLGLTMFLSTFMFAQTWEEVTIINGDFTLTDDSLGHGGSSINSDTVPGWFFDGPEATNISRGLATLKYPEGDVKEYLVTIGFNGGGVGGGTIFNIVDSNFETGTQYKLSYDVRCSWLAKVDSAYHMAYFACLNEDDSRTMLDSTHFTLLPGKTTDEAGKDMFIAKEFILDMAEHPEAIGKKIIVEFGVPDMSWKAGEMTMATVATWSMLDNVTLAKSASTASLQSHSSLGAKIYVNQQLLTVELPTLTKGTLNIYNIGGSRVFTDQVNTSIYTRQLNLQKGVYIVKMNTQADSQITKLYID